MNPVLLQKQKELFLEALAQSGNVTSAARIAGWIYPTIAESYRKEDPNFSLAWTDAQRQANDALQAEARRRAIEGVDEPVYYKGEHVGSITKYSDKLLETLLKAEMPEKFKESVSNDGEERGVLVVPRSPKTITVDEWEADATRQQQELLSRTQ